MPSDDELRKAVAPLAAANDVKALAAMWRGGAFLLTTDAALKAARFPMIEIIGTLDPAVSEVEPLRKAASADQDARAGRRKARRRTRSAAPSRDDGGVA